MPEHGHRVWGGPRKTGGRGDNGGSRRVVRRSSGGPCAAGGGAGPRARHRSEAAEPVAARLAASRGQASSPPRSAAWSVPGRKRLRHGLAVTDLAVTCLAWLWVFNALNVHHGTFVQQVVPLGVIGATAVVILAFKQLYLSRVCRVRVIEVSLLARASLALALAIYLAESPLNLDLSIQRSLAGAGTTWLALCLSRGLYSSWLGRKRERGHHTRPIVIMGPPDQGAQLSRLLADNPGCGLRAAAVIDHTIDVLEALEENRSDSVLLINGAWPEEEQRRLVRRLHEVGVHVHYSSGFRGIDHRRLRPLPIGREPLFYIEPVTVSPWQLFAKRAVDIVGSVAGLVVSAPFLLLAAIAVKLDGGGPLIYRQERVGLGGHPFRVFKLRTMVRDAEAQLHLVHGDNERHGPLFKARHDRRVTRVGRILRATSLDELPQLLNVLRGSMSLVGPRPALAHEVAQFDIELQERTRVKPGMTGLWQIEGREAASFEVYRRLDLYYVDNWTLELDFVILLTTCKAVAIKAFSDLWSRRSGPGQAADVIGVEPDAHGVTATIDLTRRAVGAEAAR